MPQRTSTLHRSNSVKKAALNMMKEQSVKNVGKSLGIPEFDKCKEKIQTTRFCYLIQVTINFVYFI